MNMELVQSIATYTHSSRDILCIDMLKCLNRSIISSWIELFFDKISPIYLNTITILLASKLHFLRLFSLYELPHGVVSKWLRCLEHPWKILQVFTLLRR